MTEWAQDLTGTIYRLKPGHTGVYEFATASQVNALEQERNALVADIESVRSHWQGELTKATDVIVATAQERDAAILREQRWRTQLAACRNENYDIRHERDALAAQLAEQTATTTLLVEALQGLVKYQFPRDAAASCLCGQDWDGERYVHRNGCPIPDVLTLLDTLPAAVAKAHARRLTLTEAFVAAEQERRDCIARMRKHKSSTYDPHAFEAKAAESYPEYSERAEQAWAALTAARRAEENRG